MTWSVHDALAGRSLLVTGATGFLGKVWLGHLLARVPGLGPLHVVVRPAAGRATDDPAAGARRRLEGLLARSPAFWPLHAAHGAGLGAWLAPRLVPLAGDVARPGLGLAAGDLERLAGRLDLVVHLAGLTTLEPDPAEALAANVDGALHALEVARATGARLVHVSTAYVAGCWRGDAHGRVPERLVPDFAPALAGRAGDGAGAAFAAAREVEDLRRLVARAREEAGSQAVEAALAASARAALDRHGAPAAELPAFLARERDRWVRARAAREADARARALGWPNVYAMTKSLAESLLARRAGDVPVCVLRPTIVEGALEDPFPGWKEGLETSGPLTWAMTRGPLRDVPCRGDLPLDVIPVDRVARALTLLAGAHLLGRAPAVAHAGSSDTNPLPVARAIDLTALAERAAGRAPADGAPVAGDDAPAAGPPAIAGARALARWLRPSGAAPAGRLAFAAQVPLGRRLLGAAREALELAHAAWPGGSGGRATALARRAARAERRLAALEDLVRRFRPFVLDHEATFEARALDALAADLPPAERALFDPDVRGLDWRAYWLEAHVPGLRRWVWPLLEGARVERGPVRPVSLAGPNPAHAPGPAPGSAGAARPARAEAGAAP